jgi:hypothetical protein
MTLAAGSSVVRIAAAILLGLGCTWIARAADVEAARIFGTWELAGEMRGRIAGPLVISRTEILWKSQRDGHQCDAAYRIASQATGSTYPGGPMVSDKPEDAYTIFTLLLQPNDCDIDTFFISISSDAAEGAHFAASRRRGVQGYGTTRLISSNQFP